MLSVCQFPRLSSLNFKHCNIGAKTREDGRTRCQRALAAEGDRGAEEVGQHKGASGNRKAVVLERLSNSWDGELANVLLGRGGLAAVGKGTEELPPFAGGQTRLMGRRRQTEGTGSLLSGARNRRSHRRPPGGGGVSSRSPRSVQYHHMVWCCGLHDWPPQRVGRGVERILEGTPGL